MSVIFLVAFAFHVDRASEPFPFIWHYKGVVPADRAYAKLIRAHSKDNNMEKVGELTKEMLSKGVEMSTEVCNELIVGCISGGNFDDALHVFDMMKADGKWAPTLFTDSKEQWPSLETLPPSKKPVWLRQLGNVHHFWQKFATRSKIDSNHGRVLFSL